MVPTHLKQFTNMVTFHLKFVWDCFYFFAVLVHGKSSDFIKKNLAKRRKIQTAKEGKVSDDKKKFHGMSFCFMALYAAKHLAPNIFLTL